MHMRFEIAHPQLVGDDFDKQRRVEFQLRHKTFEFSLGEYPFQCERAAYTIIFAVELREAELLVETVHELLQVMVIVRRTIEYVTTYVCHNKFE